MRQGEGGGGGGGQTENDAQWSTARKRSACPGQGGWSLEAWGSSEWSEVGTGGNLQGLWATQGYECEGQSEVMGGLFAEKWDGSFTFLKRQSGLHHTFTSWT